MRWIGKPGPQLTLVFRRLFDELAASMRRRVSGYPDCIASCKQSVLHRSARVTHFYSEDKLTCEMADGKPYSIDHTLTDLEQRLDPNRFIRIHRTTLINAGWVKEIATGVSGSLVVGLKDARQTELTVARNRVHQIKTRLGV